MEALVYKSTGSWYQVKGADGKMMQARVKGKLKMDDITSTNPVAVGDWVDLAVDPVTREANITGVHTRRNYINRQSPHRRHQHHIVASNLDQCLLFATLREPRTSLGFIDRFLVTAEAFHVPAILVFNKLDIYREKEKDALQEIQAIYGPIGYRVMALSLQTGEGLPQLMDCLQGKTTLISGHSGVGKSTFINSVMPDTALRTQDVSDWSGKGMHTTTFAEMFDLPQGGHLIDTPGIREMGIVSVKQEELSHYFPEMRDRLTQCKFNNCQHIQEPGCAIKDAVSDGNIREERYLSYLSIWESLASDDHGSR
jgi:ribosome biogenesis GTPase